MPDLKEFQIKFKLVSYLELEIVCRGVDATQDNINSGGGMVFKDVVERARALQPTGDLRGRGEWPHAAGLWDDRDFGSF